MALWGHYNKAYCYLCRPTFLDTHDTNFFFFALTSSLSYVKNQLRLKKKFKKLKTRFFRGPKVLLFCLLSVPWTGNKLAGDDVENCENSQLTLTNLSQLL